MRPDCGILIEQIILMYLCHVEDDALTSFKLCRGKAIMTLIQDGMSHPDQPKIL